MTSTSRRRRASERRAQLIDTGRSAFAEQGYEATSVEQIAKRAKVSKPIIYEHFGGKEGLYAVIVDREMSYVERRIIEAISSGSPRERVERASLAFLNYVRDHPDGFAVLSQDSPLTSSPGTMSSLLHDMADRVGDDEGRTLFSGYGQRRGVHGAGRYDGEAAPGAPRRLAGARQDRGHAERRICAFRGDR